MIHVAKIAISILFSGLLYLHAGAISPNRVYRFYPERMGLIYKELQVTTPDGLEIKTWFFPAQTKLNDAEQDRTWSEPTKREYKPLDNKQRPTVIICNGDAGNMSYQQLVFAQVLTDKGYNVVTFDWRGFGESGEWAINTDYLVYTEMLTDYAAVIQQVLLQREVDTSNLALFGWSTGAYLSMAASHDQKAVKCLIAIGLMTTFEDAMPLLNNVSKNKSTQRQLIIPADYSSKLQPLALASTYNKSTLLIVGERDDRTPVWMSEKIYALLPSTKKLWVVKGAGHTIINESQERWTQVNGVIVGFLDENLR